MHHDLEHGLPVLVGIFLGERGATCIGCEVGNKNVDVSRLFNHEVYRTRFSQVAGVSNNLRPMLSEQGNSVGPHVVIGLGNQYSFSL